MKKVDDNRIERAIPTIMLISQIHGITCNEFFVSILAQLALYGSKE